ncbi:hypothetical protein G6F50_015101 [Rhizopus delemar]|uniref:Uncharacterized protein n=1 Tax=Rhizopus delemar TaxID=936053 RepID=A0A9P6XZZ6_9FUNG|nr:hypothetical protein G6F50_015101 [Rhizopus delemar]
MRTAMGRPSRNRKSWRGRQSATAWPTCAGAWCAVACASAARCPKASRWGCRPVSIRAARWTTSTATKPVARARWGAWSIATIWMRSAGAASACVASTCRNCCAMLPSACAGRARRCACWTWLPAMAATCWKRWARANSAPIASCCVISAT